MKQLMNFMGRETGEKQRKAVLRLELDYELATLFEAMSESDKRRITECKEKLKKIRQELLALKAL